MYLLDTNICIALIDKHPQAIAKFYPRFSQCGLSTIVIAELYQGAYCSQKIAENLRDTRNFINLIPTIVQFDEDAALEFGIIQSELKRIGRPTQKLDGIIAAVARSRGDILVTHNIKDFINIPGLQLEDWLEETQEETEENSRY